MSASPNSKPTGPINVDDRTVEHTKWQFLKEHGTVLDLARFIEKENPIIYAGDARRLLQVRIEQSTDIARLQRLVDEYPAASFHYEVKGRLQDLGWTKPSLSRPTRILGSQTPMKGSRRFLAGLALTAAIVLAAIALDRTEVVSISSLWRPEHSKEVRPPLTDAQRQIEAQFKVLVATGGREQLERFALAHPEYAQRVADELARRERAVAAAKAKQDKVDADRREAAAKAAAQAAADRHREIIARIARETDRDALLKISGDEPIHRKAVEQRLGALGYIQVSTAQDPVWLKPGAGKTEWFKDCPTCPEMVVAPADRFTMGSPAGEPRREPYHKGSEDQFPVTIGRPFAVGRFAVTRGEFAAFVAATGHKTEGGCFAYTGTDWKLQADRNWRSPGFTQTDRHPVVCVNWNDAQAYVSWLASTTKKSYRLQSDSEREYVARAGTTTPFWWGQAISATQANYDANYVYDGGIKGEWRKATVPVESFAANPWGLYNVHGNVSDWTEDCWNTTNAGNPGDGQARTTGECSFRVVRGGAWLSNPRSLRSAYRYYDSSGFRYSSLGFRVARTLDATPSAAQR